MKFKDFQEDVLRRLSLYLGHLREESERCAQVAAVAAANPGLGIAVPDFTEAAWAKLAAAGELPAARAEVPFSPRRDGVGRPVPNVCLKVPTGGGKTLLATAAVSRILSQYQQRRTGFVLWICPNEAIYTQTRMALRDRQHPYRHMLDQASGGRTRVLDKDDPLSRAEVDGQLCVMLLMLQSANRETRESLRLFKDRGNVHGFFPEADDKAGHEDWLARVPNLDHYADVMLQWFVVKDSLGNALRCIQPIVVMDEGHKGYSRLAMETVYGFNPSFVLELSATPVDRPSDSPPVHSNWLCDVRGTDLDREHMVKLPMNVTVQAGNDWRACIGRALEQLNVLQRDADHLHAECARYIRPICLVQVERTGKEQRDGQHVHAQDVREYLQTLGLRDDQIAIKSAEQNDLKAFASDGLVQPNNPIRFIITKQALQEGWDCPFAYVLCSLAKVTSKGAMTQLVGRILRQPDTQKTGFASLDECYVFCVHSRTRDVVDAIKNGLEQDGMGDLATQVRERAGDGGGSGSPETRLERRDAFRQLRIFLPLVHWLEDGHRRELDYEMDILPRLDPRQVELASLAQRLIRGGEDSTSQSLRINLATGRELVRMSEAGSWEEAPGFDPVYVCRALSDLIPNPWQARELINRLVFELGSVGADVAHLGERTGYLVAQLRQHLESEFERLGEQVFAAEVAAGRIRLSLHTDGRKYEVPEGFDALLAKPLRGLMRSDGHPVEKSLFVPATEDGLNGLERNVACYLDSRRATRWWFRNVAKTQYGLQGWRRNRVYPDLVASLDAGDQVSRLLVLETKGSHLENQDTSYKKRLLEALTRLAASPQAAGDLSLELDAGLQLHFELVFENQWENRLATLADVLT